MEEKSLQTVYYQHQKGECFEHIKRDVGVWWSCQVFPIRTVLPYRRKVTLRWVPIWCPWYHPMGGVALCLSRQTLSTATSSLVMTLERYLSLGHNCWEILTCWNNLAQQQGPPVPIERTWTAGRITLTPWSRFTITSVRVHEWRFEGWFDTSLDGEIIINPILCLGAERKWLLY